MEPPLIQLQARAAAAPLLWAPVLASILHHHSKDMPESCFVDLLHTMHQQEYIGISTPAEVLWTLRSHHALAAAWPSTLMSENQHVQKAGGAVSAVDKQWKVCPTVCYTTSDTANAYACSTFPFLTCAALLYPCACLRVLFVGLVNHQCSVAVHFVRSCSPPKHDVCRSPYFICTEAHIADLPACLPARK